MSLNKNRKTIALFIPFLSGYYFSCIIKELRKNALKHNLDVLVIMTGGQDKYHSSISIERIDAAYIVLNSVAPSFVDLLIEKGIPVATTVEDYIPKPIETICTDQISGIIQAFNHLYDLGHRKIGFAGDFSVPDFRIRFGAMLDCYSEKNENFNPEWLYTVSEPSMPGGTQAGKDFVLREEKCTAMICAADLIAVGVLETVRKAGFRVPEDLAIVGVDNTSVGMRHSPTITSIDQGLEKMVATAVERLVARSNGALLVSQRQLIPQTLKPRQSSGTPEAELNRDAPRPQASHMEDNFEGAMAHAGLGYEWIKNLSRLWGPFFKWSLMGHWLEVGEPITEKSQLKIKDAFMEAIEGPDLSVNNGKICDGKSFPPQDLEEAIIPDPAFVTVLPVNPEGISWGALGIVDELTDDINYAEYGMFHYYLVLMFYFMQRDALTDSVKQREKNARELAKHMEIVANSSNDGIWTWNIETNTIDWNNRLLEMLGFTSSDEKQQYRNMTLLERVHPLDHEYVKQSLKEHFEYYHPFKINFRVRAKSGRYLWVEANGEAIREKNGHISRFVGALTDITDQRRSEQRIEHMAYHDGLTGLLNRISISEKIKEHIAMNNPAVAIMVMDLNRFKMVNDSFGHQVGDALLNYVAIKANAVLREGDLLARFGGDEFVFMCRAKNEEEATSVSERILESVVDTFHYENYEIAVHASLGISLFPHHGDNYEELIKKADIAMYKSKVNKLKHATLYTEDMDVDIKKRIEMEIHLRKAIEANELFLVLQPQIETHTGDVVGCEALVRWHSENFGLVSPGTFIPLAEEIGLIGDIGEWVIDTSIDILKSWKDKNIPSAKIAINVSAGQLHQNDFAETIIEKIKVANVHPSWVNLEITETAAITNMEHSREQLQALKDFGIEISLDDFGTGYSSLNLLNDLPLNWVKIDRSFINKITERDVVTGMTKSITEMCHSLGYRVVAEGVETPEQYAIIKQINCERIQGFFFSKPVTTEEFEQSFLGKTINKSS